VKYPNKKGNYPFSLCFGGRFKMAQTIGYLRVSTIHQDLEKNKMDILKLANDKKLGNVVFVSEKVSGTKNWKERKLGKVIEDLKENDNLIVSELSRLGRSMLQIMQILAIAIEKGIKIFSVKGNWTLDNSLQSKILAMVFSLASELERELISLRTKEALRVRKEKGLKLGRPCGAGKIKLDKFRPEIEALLVNGATKKFITGRFDVTPNIVCNWLNKNGISRKDLIDKKAVNL